MPQAIFDPFPQESTISANTALRALQTLRLVVQYFYFIHNHLTQILPALFLMTKETPLAISKRVSIPLSEIELTPIRASGPGGQNVNKVSTAIHLRFDIHASSLPDFYKTRLLALSDRRISKEGIIVIKAQQARTQEQNRNQALERLAELVQHVAQSRKKRIPTKPSFSTRRKRTDDKTRRGRDKALRKKTII